VIGTHYSLAGLSLGSNKIEIQACNASNQCGVSYLAGTVSRSSRVRYQHTDMLGTPVMETDESGYVISRSVYEPFGKRLGGEKAGLGFTGHLQDEDLGLTYMQARYYDPLIGRFYSNDPIGFRDIHSFNRYAYANNNPYKYTDPTGLTSWPVNKNSNGQVVVTSNFGKRNTGIKGASKSHSGTDFRAAKGAKITATESGTVSKVGGGGRGGNYILISNDDGSMSGHAHTQSAKGLKAGDKVSEGSTIGQSDGSGTGNAPHQHYTYREGTTSSPATATTPKVDPMKTQFKNMPKQEVCVKGSGGGC
ncbi:MAG: peptidoglycan DD-metalloendopeptidase family protein, partial [Shewanella sp.]|nr:peptidoglycan DD-metalloendopeptidase family protein [Shewanella sp.]